MQQLNPQLLSMLPLVGCHGNSWLTVFPLAVATGHFLPKEELDVYLRKMWAAAAARLRFFRTAWCVHWTPHSVGVSNIPPEWSSMLQSSTADLTSCDSQWRTFDQLIVFKSTIDGKQEATNRITWDCLAAASRDSGWSSSSVVLLAHSCSVSPSSFPGC